MGYIHDLLIPSNNNNIMKKNKYIRKFFKRFGIKMKY